MCRGIGWAGGRAGVSKGTSGGHLFGREDDSSSATRDGVIFRVAVPTRPRCGTGVLWRVPPRCLGSESSHWQADLSAYHALVLSSSRRRWWGWGCGLIAFSQSLTRSVPYSRPLLKGLTALTPSEDGAYGFDMPDGGTGDTRFTRSVCSLRLGVDLSESVLWVCGESDLNRTCMPLHDI